MHPTILALRERRVIRRNRSEATLAQAERNARMHDVKPKGLEVSVPLQGDFNSARTALMNKYGPVESIRVETDYSTKCKSIVANRVVQAA
jgi:hypothetical protein